MARLWRSVPRVQTPAVPRIDRLLMMCLLGLMLTGGHLGLLRVVAWTSMVIDRCCNQSLTLAISTTFDGEHPCHLCRAISQQQDEGHHDKRLPTVIAKVAKIIALVEERWLQPPTSAVMGHSHRPDARDGVGIVLQPPVPPPRLS